MSIELPGKWFMGKAYDYHTLASSYLGVDEQGIRRWDTKYTEMGRLLHDLKYGHKRVNVSKIMDLVTARIKGLETFDCIIPVPASKPRNFQPVEELAKELGRRKRVRVVNALKKKEAGVQIKDIVDLKERKKALENTLILAGDFDFSGKKILLLDDLFRSGVTLEVGTNILYKKAKADTVCVLTMTKTRSNR